MYPNSWYEEEIKGLQENQRNVTCSEKIIYNRLHIAINFMNNY